MLYLALVSVEPTDRLPSSLEANERITLVSGEIPPNPEYAKGPWSEAQIAAVREGLKLYLSNSHPNALSQPNFDPFHEVFDSATQWTASFFCDQANSLGRECRRASLLYERLAEATIDQALTIKLYESF